ncbi:alpha/beta hydrolase [Shimazuella kribbensis]|uniref:alpha/beta hydrolase n=1 Tax=Shimazuella kribbensis TaxID=139808 RepID=UPI000401BFD2|nr:alpha/beta hydrolase [Shimazuella kribbensis]
MEKEFWLKMSDGQEVYVHKWYNQDVEPKGILQLSHGMAEHIRRYHGFANFLVSHGIFVYGNDHRGHGRTGEKSELFGFFTDENGFERVVKDIKEINDFIHQQYPETPVFLMGHSMGSFLVRRFVQLFHGKIKGVIISGTAGKPLFGQVGKMIAKYQIRTLGKRTKSSFMNKMIFGSYNKHFKDAKTDFDWLSKDIKEVQKFIDDPYCGFIPTTGFYYDLLSGLEEIHKEQEIRKIEKDLPFFIFSGDKDPVGNNTKGVLSVIRQYKKHGINNMEYVFYQEGRHEMLFELNRDEVKKRVLQWLEKQLENM